MRKIAKESIFQLLPRNARFYLTTNLNSHTHTKPKSPTDSSYGGQYTEHTLSKTLIFVQNWLRVYKAPHLPIPLQPNPMNFPNLTPKNKNKNKSLSILTLKVSLPNELHPALDLLCQLKSVILSPPCQLMTGLRFENSQQAPSCQCSQGCDARCAHISECCKPRQVSGEMTALTQWNRGGGVLI